MLLEPTPIRLQRADEDALAAELQELVNLFMKVQFGEQGTSVTRMESATTLDYVLFSDIEENSWTMGKKDPYTPPGTVLRFNGGVVSFQGKNTPSEDEVNEWVEAAIDGLFAPALQETPYQYIERTQYMTIEDPNSVVTPADIQVNSPTGESRPAEATAQQPQTEFSGGTADDDTSLLYILSSALCVIAVVVVVLALWIRHNNRAVRMLVFGDRDAEEVVDFSDEGASVSINHEAGNAHESKNKSLYEDDDDDEDEDDDDYALKKDSCIDIDNDVKSQISIATQCAVEEATQSATEEASLQSGSTFPTLSALSFRNPNPFSTKSIMSQESFQRERKPYLSKDMMYSPWSEPPNLDFMYGKRKDESVLQPSYFSAEKERAIRSSKKFSVNAKNDEKTVAGFQFEAAHGDGGDRQDKLYITQSRPAHYQ